MTIKIGAKNARAKFSELIGRVGFGHEEIVIERSGKPLAALIPMDMYEQTIAEREERFKIVKKLQDSQPELPAGQVEEDVSDMVKKARAERAAGGH